MAEYKSFVDFVDVMKKGRVACFTGHRPASFPFKYNEDSYACQLIKTKLLELINLAYSQGFRTFISGMAMGVDMWAVEELFELEGEGLDKLVILGAIPCHGQSSKWIPETKERYKRLLDRLDGWIYVHDGPYDGGFRMINRNEAMVAASELTIAVYGGNNNRSGTGHCVRYSLNNGNRVLVYDWVEGTTELREVK